MRLSSLAVLSVLWCQPPATAFVAPIIVSHQHRRAGVFPEHPKKAPVGPLGVGEEVGDLARIVDLSSIFLLLAPATALAAGQVAQAQKNKLSKQVTETEAELEEIKDYIDEIKSQIKSTDAQIAVSCIAWNFGSPLFLSCFIVTYKPVLVVIIIGLCCTHIGLGWIGGCELVRVTAIVPPAFVDDH